MESVKDWHRADIIAEIKKKGTSVAEVSRKVGLSSSTLANVLYRPWPKGEHIIASVIGVPPEKIWPSRYYENDVFQDRKKRMRKYHSRSPTA
ncbi:helix-turn-helix transcriptional regulator [Pectobacterium polaris]|uniref:helix-turn-helix domain-containing protein n=1 Tax=Pectobacterium polaris TaxID=2042057 RepID=UPI0023B1B31D|nr:helix-turn-helix transcriptional regulator [Pectobacterium polaris]MDE8741527.1 helix-turn-helix transcriptional regulator [Pectobacterium polaris]